MYVNPACGDGIFRGGDLVCPVGICQGQSLYGDFKALRQQCCLAEKAMLQILSNRRSCPVDILSEIYKST